MKVIILLISMLLAASIPCDSRASERDADLHNALARAAASFDDAVRQLESDPQAAESSLRAAIAAHQSIAQAGVENGKLYYNLGNAYLLLGDTGRAVLNYRRAEQFIPNDPNLQANLAEALSRVRADFIATTERSIIDRARRVVALAPTSALVWIAIGAWAIGWSLLLVRLGARAFPRWPALASISIALMASAVVAADLWLRSIDHRAVVIAAETVGRKGPDAGAYAPSFAAPLPAGVEVQVLAQRPEWSLVRLPDDRETWIARADIAPLWPEQNTSQRTP